MIDEELLNKFDRIQDLPVSEEMLGAYLEGNLSESEIDDVELMIQYQPEINNLCEEVTQICDSSIPSNNSSDGFDYDIALSSSNFLGDMEMGNIINSQDLLQDFDLPNLDGIFGGTANNVGNENDIFGLDLSSRNDLDF